MNCHIANKSLAGERQLLSSYRRYEVSASMFHLTENASHFFIAMHLP